MSKRKNSPNHGWQKSFPGQRKDVKSWFHQRQELELKLYQAQMLMGPPSVSERHYAKDLIIRDGIAVEVKGDGHEQGCSLSNVRGCTEPGGCVVFGSDPVRNLEIAKRTGIGCEVVTDESSSLSISQRSRASKAQSRKSQKAEA